MGRFQKNKGNMRPVMDYHELNDHMNAKTARANICSQRLRDWRRDGCDELVLNLSLSLSVCDRSLWPFQFVLIKGWKLCLTRIEFALDVAPSIMLSIVEAVQSKDETIQLVTFAYIEDVYVMSKTAWRPQSEWGGIYLGSGSTARTCSTSRAAHEC